MRVSSIITSVAAAGLLGTAAMAQTTAGGGVAASTPRGSVAGGATAGTMSPGQQKHMQHRDGRAQGSSSSTYGSGTIYTDRTRATGAVTAGGTATGSGATASGTSVDAYGATDRRGSTGEVFGDSTANAASPPR
jgi:hypothetical protein